MITLSQQENIWIICWANRKALRETALHVPASWSVRLILSSLWAETTARVTRAMGTAQQNCRHHLMTSPRLEATLLLVATLEMCPSHLHTASLNEVIFHRENNVSRKLCLILPLNWILWTLINSYLNDSFSKLLKPGTFLPHHRLALELSPLNGCDNSGWHLAWKHCFILVQQSKQAILHYLKTISVWLQIIYPPVKLTNKEKSRADLSQVLSLYTKARNLHLLLQHLHAILHSASKPLLYAESC